jgi:hypothetical protein
MKNIIILLFLGFALNSYSQTPHNFRVITCSDGTGFIFDTAYVKQFKDSTAITYDIEKVVYLNDKKQYQFQFDDYVNTRNKITYHPASGTVIVQINFTSKYFDGCYKEY